jgi:hypothetical protein
MRVQAGRTVCHLHADLPRRPQKGTGVTKQPAAHTSAKNEKPENGGRRTELPPDIRAVLTRALVAAIVAEIRDEN